MQGHDFEVALKSLGAVLGLLERQPLEQMREHLTYAESVAPIFGTEAIPGTGRIAELRQFLTRALAFQAECVRYRVQISEALLHARAVLPPAIPADSAPEGP